MSQPMDHAASRAMNVQGQCDSPKHIGTSATQCAEATWTMFQSNVLVQRQYYSPKCRGNVAAPRHNLANDHANAIFQLQYFMRQSTQSQLSRSTKAQKVSKSTRAASNHTQAWSFAAPFPSCLRSAAFQLVACISL